MHATAIKYSVQLVPATLKSVAKTPSRLQHYYILSLFHEAFLHVTPEIPVHCVRNVIAEEAVIKYLGHITDDVLNY